MERARFYNGECGLVIKRWLNRVDEIASGLTFGEGDPTENVESSQMPVAMIINSSELRVPGFTLREVFPPELEAAARCRSTRGAGIRQLEGIDHPKKMCVKNHQISPQQNSCGGLTPGAVVLAHTDRALSLK